MIFHRQRWLTIGPAWPIKIRSSTSWAGVSDFGGVVCNNMVNRSVSVNICGGGAGKFPPHSPVYRVVYANQGEKLREIWKNVKMHLPALDNSM